MLVTVKESKRCENSSDPESTSCERYEDAVLLIKELRLRREVSG